MTSAATEAPPWLVAAASWLTRRRIRAQAVLLAGCLWGACVTDFATTGLFDRAGNIKFQDFLQFYISAKLIRENRSAQLFDQAIGDRELEAIAYPAGPPSPTYVRLPRVYGPQVGLLFVPLARLPFLTAASIWTFGSLLLFFVCVYLVWRSCPALRPHLGIAAICALAFPALFHFFVRGQISVLITACFTAAYLALRAGRPWLAGFSLGLLVLKPPFLVAIPLVLLLACAWKLLVPVALSAAAQLAFAWMWFGSSVMRAYLDAMWNARRWIEISELSLAPIQMHSLRSFWTLLIPWPHLAFGLYLLTSLAAIAIAAAVWKSQSPLPLPLRFSALTLAAVLVNPHLFVYDLLVLAPALLLLADWALSRSSRDFSAAALRMLIYLSFALSLLGPLSHWTHLQLSVPAFAAMLWILWRQSMLAAKPTP